MNVFSKVSRNASFVSSALNSNVKYTFKSLCKPRYLSTSLTSQEQRLFSKNKINTSFLFLNQFNRNYSNEAINYGIPESSPVRQFGTGKALKVRFTKDHEWVGYYEDGIAFIGITKYAADSLGDLVYVELPEEGADVNREDTIGSVESVKAASDIFAPLSGEILAVNVKLAEQPDLINSDPTGEGWIVRMQIADLKEAEALFDEEAYKEYLKTKE